MGPLLHSRNLGPTNKRQFLRESPLSEPSNDQKRNKEMSGTKTQYATPTKLTFCFFKRDKIYFGQSNDFIVFADPTEVLQFLISTKKLKKQDSWMTFYANRFNSFCNLKFSMKKFDSHPVWLVLWSQFSLLSEPDF